VCMCVDGVGLHTLIHTHTHTHSHSHTFTHTHSPTPTHIHTLTHPLPHTHTHTHSHTSLVACVWVFKISDAQIARVFGQRRVLLPHSPLLVDENDSISVPHWGMCMCMVYVYDMVYAYEYNVVYTCVCE
jgi:hypothetical protein